MSQTIWIPHEYTSQFGLLGAVAHELHSALTSTGHDARLVSVDEMKRLDSGVLLFMNTPTTIDMLPDALFAAEPTMRAVQYMVDHPFALPDTIIDQWSQRNGLTNYRLCLPCADDAHLLRARFPGLVHRWVAHGVPGDSLCDLESITEPGMEARRFDVVVTGSVRSQEEIEKSMSGLPTDLAGMARDIAAMMIRTPHLGYVAAADLVMGTRGAITGDWKTIKLLWALVIAMVNRVRRLSTVQALQGLRVGVFGSSAWASVCTGTIEYAGEVTYSDSASAFAQGRVGLAWGPSQFVHSYSERIMQAMAGGACVVCDDRLLAARDFGDACARFDWSDAAHARACVDSVLANPAGMVAMARRGRALVEQRCLWTHRVETMLSI